MAAKAKEETIFKEKSMSAPSTPRRIHVMPTRHSSIDLRGQDTSMLPEKPMPNYLRPTISSYLNANCSSRKKNEQTSEKHNPPRTPIRSTIPVNIEKASKILARTRSLPKAMTKRIETHIDTAAAMAANKHDQTSSKQCKGSPVEDKRSKVKECEAKVVVKKVEKESSAQKMHEMQGKETLPAYNDVVEKTMSKHAVKRNKVKALVGAFEKNAKIKDLVGAFETVISPRESGQQHEVATAEGNGKVDKVERKVESVSRQEIKDDEMSQINKQEEGEKSKDCQPGQQQEEEEGKGRKSEVVEKEGSKVITD